MSSPGEQRFFNEGVVVRVGDVEVGVANVFEGSYELPDGSARSGMTAELIPLLGAEQNPSHTVGRGSVVELGGVCLEVTEVVAGPRGSGRVTVRELP